MKKQFLLITVIVSIFFYSCAPTINYFGKRYTPTQKVDIYFDQADIKKDYTVMGKMDNEMVGMDNDDPEAVQNAMIEKAKEVGADAILFGDYENKVISQETIYNQNKNRTYGAESSYKNMHKHYKATLLKYNK